MILYKCYLILISHNIFKMPLMFNLGNLRLQEGKFLFCKMILMSLLKSRKNLFQEQNNQLELKTTVKVYQILLFKIKKVCSYQNMRWQKLGAVLLIINILLTTKKIMTLEKLLELNHKEEVLLIK